uniref:Reverse transcriptase domain-containing protein n=1 Tax=Tanacetum cinerariifolium TaxID=118510 RepID=A0A6L2NFL3_TANCI|nr:hypothetical protein [Tanacetum cinerariifolium]
MGKVDIDTLTMEQYMALTRGNHVPGVLRHKIANNVNLEIKGQFMKELRDKTVAGNRDNDANEHVQKMLEISDMFNIPGVDQDAIMLIVFPIGGSQEMEGAVTSMIDQYLVPSREAVHPKILKSKQLTNLQIKRLGLSHLRLQLPSKKVKRQGNKSKKNQIGASVYRKTQCVLLNGFSKQTATEGKRSRNFTLPFLIGSLSDSNALADLGASISVMQFSMFKPLGLGNPKPINMLIEMADKSMQTLKGIIENVLVKIDKIIFLVDLVILDIAEDNKVPIILERPLLATAYAKINVFGKQISIEVRDEKIISKESEVIPPLPLVYVCVVNNVEIPNDFGVQVDLEDFLMSNDLMMTLVTF